MNTHVQIYIKTGRGKRRKDRERGERKGSRRKEKGRRNVGQSVGKRGRKVVSKGERDREGEGGR